MPDCFPDALEAFLGRLPLGIQFDSLRKTLARCLEFEILLETQPLVGQRHDRVEVARTYITCACTRVVGTDSDSKLKQAHGLNRIGSRQRSLGIGQCGCEHLFNFFEQRIDQIDCFAVLLRSGGIVARKIGLVTFGVNGLRLAETQSAPSLHGATLQRLHFGQQLAENVVSV